VNFLPTFYQHFRFIKITNKNKKSTNNNKIKQLQALANVGKWFCVKIKKDSQTFL